MKCIFDSFVNVINYNWKENNVKRRDNTEISIEVEVQYDVL